MPSLRQSLFWLLIHSEAKLSTFTNTPTNLWHLPSDQEKKTILRTNWYDFHQIFILTFKIDPLKETQTPLPLILSFYFLTPQWYLIPEFNLSINSCWEKSLSSRTPSIVTTIHSSPSPAHWFLLKQNDPDLLRLITSSIIQNKIFIPPLTPFILTPLGVTPPLVNLKKRTLSPLNIDPTSDKLIKGGHKLYILRSYATAADF